MDNEHDGRQWGEKKRAGPVCRRCAIDPGEPDLRGLCDACFEQAVIAMQKRLPPMLLGYLRRTQGGDDSDRR